MVVADAVSSYIESLAAFCGFRGVNPEVKGAENVGELGNGW